MNMTVGKFQLYLRRVTDALVTGFRYALFVSVIGLLAYIIYRTWSNYYELGWSGIVGIWLNMLRHLILMLALAAGVIAVVAIAVGIQAITGRWRKIRIFISYQHEHLMLVSNLKSALNSPWLEADFVPFSPADHDTIIDTVRRRVKETDILLVLPGSDRSFVDAEILAASILEKPIVFLRLSNDQTTPDTALKGYPVFDLLKLQEHQFRPLQRFLLYVSRSSRDMVRNFIRASADFYKQFDLIFSIYFVVGSMSRLSYDILATVNVAWASTLGLAFLWLITALLVGIFVVSYARVVIERLRAIRIVRQRIITGDLTFELLAKGLGRLRLDLQVLNCILRHSPPTRH